MEKNNIIFEASIDGEYCFEYNKGPHIITTNCWTQIPIMPDVFEVFPQDGTYIVQTSMTLSENIWYEGGIIGLDINKYSENHIYKSELKYIGLNKTKRIKNKYKLISTKESLTIRRSVKITNNEPLRLYVYQNSGVNLELI